MADIQSAAAEIRRGKRKRRKKKNKPQHENIMVCPIPYGDHNNNNNNNCDYGAVITTKVTARVHPVHTV